MEYVPDYFLGSRLQQSSLSSQREYGVRVQGPARRSRCLLLCLLFSACAFAQSTHKSDFVSIDTGDPSWASFYFGDSVTLVGDTVLIIQCDFNRAELITNFHVYGKQMSSGFFPITCTEINPRHFILDAAPFTVDLTMHGYNHAPQNLTLTVDSATWRTVGHGRYAEHIGAAQIAF